MKFIEETSNQPTAFFDMQKFKDYNNTFKKLPIDTLDNLFYQKLDLHGNKPAIISQDYRLTYNDLNLRSNQVARYLIENNIKRGSCVAIVGHRDPISIAYIMGILKAGCVFVPVDPSYPADRIEYIIQNSNISLILDVDSFDTLKMGNCDPSDVRNNTSLNELAYIIYTSGSTGRPKGVMITHQAAANTIIDINERFSVTEKDTIIGLSSLAFDLSIYDVFGALSTGASLYMISDIRNTENIFEVIEKNNVTFWNSVPSVMGLLVESLILKDEKPNYSLKNILLSGDWIPVSLPEKISRFFPNADITSLGGATEGSIWSIYYPIKNVDKKWKSIPYGYPLTNQQFYVLNDALEHCEVDEEGALFIGGDGVASGYYNDEVKTRNAFIQHPNLGYIYKTGDYGVFRKEGYIDFLGRKDNQVKIGGNRIELGEIEFQLNSLEGILEATCVVRDMDDSKKLVAFIKPHGAFTIDAFSKEEIGRWRNELRTTLPDYMIPVEWIKIDKLPLTSNGKVDRNALKEFVPQKAKENTTDEENNGLDRIAEIIKAIWKKELKLDHIENDEDFFELGGHSMVAIRIMSQIKNDLDIQIPIASLFDHPTINSLVEIVHQKNPVLKNEALITIKESGSKPPLYLIHGGNLNIMKYKELARYLDKDRPVYGLQGLSAGAASNDLRDIESIASRYLTEILQKNPDGPYLIIGYSFGGIVAFEMAKQLQAMNKTISFLGVLDTYVNPFHKSSKLEHYYNKIFRQLKKGIFFSKNFVKHPLETYNYQKLVFKKRFDKHYVGSEDDQIFDFDEQTIKAYMNAYNKYVLKPLNIEMNLFKAQKRVYYIDDPQYLGWKKYANGGVKIYSIPGDHKTFLDPPNNKILAEVIDSAIAAF